MKNPIYLIYWKDDQIGEVFQNSKKQYKYIPYIAKIDKLSEDGLLKSLVSKEQLNWGEMPVFFETRIQTDPNFKNDCRSNTDFFRIIKCNPNSSH